MATDPHIDRDQPEQDDKRSQQGEESEFAEAEDREDTDATFRQKGREIMNRFRDAFAALAE